MPRSARLAAAVGLLIASIPLALIGAFAVLYEGETGEERTHVKLAGEEVDARLFGTVLLLIALFAVAAAAALLLRRGRSREPVHSGPEANE